MQLLLTSFKDKTYYFNYIYIYFEIAKFINKAIQEQDMLKIKQIVIPQSANSTDQNSNELLTISPNY
jgi:hypothetical protein